MKGYNWMFGYVMQDSVSVFKDVCKGENGKRPVKGLQRQHEDTIQQTWHSNRLLKMTD